METLIFSTNNRHKADEIRSVLGNDFSITTLQESGINIEIPEPHDTLEANAGEKASVIYQLTGKDCFSEDTGLEVDALDGEPGVKSARYAGENSSSVENINKLLNRLSASKNRKARFRTVICLLKAGKEYFFDGICPGTISNEQKGLHGFGYDPVFIPDGSKKTFAEMDMAEKNVYSHRKKAMDKLLAFLTKK